MHNAMQYTLKSTINRDKTEKKHKHIMTILTPFSHFDNFISERVKQCCFILVTAFLKIFRIQIFLTIPKGSMVFTSSSK